MHFSVEGVFVADVNQFAAQSPSHTISFAFESEHAGGIDFASFSENFCRGELVGARPWRGSVQFSRHSHINRFMRPFPVVLNEKGVVERDGELGVRLSKIWSQLKFNGAVESLDFSLSLGMSGSSLQRADAQPPEPGFQRAWTSTSVRGKAAFVIGQDGFWQSVFSE